MQQPVGLRGAVLLLVATRASQAFAGSATIDSLASCGANGTFSLSFESFDGGAAMELSGRFSADYCIGKKSYGLLR